MALLGLFQEVARFLQELAVDTAVIGEARRSRTGEPHREEVHGSLQQLGVLLLSTSQEREQVNMITGGLEPFKARVFKFQKTEQSIQEFEWNFRISKMLSDDLGLAT